jgi:hypothetical protein
MQRKENFLQQCLKQEEDKALERRSSVPAKYHQPSQFMPGGGSSLADVITEVDGLTWLQVQTVIKYAGIKNFPPPPTTMEMEVKLHESMKPGADPLGGGSFAQTRSHNGLGWRNRTKPKVRLPSVIVEVADRKVQNTKMNNKTEKTKEDNRVQVCTPAPIKVALPKVVPVAQGS